MYGLASEVISGPATIALFERLGNGVFFYITICYAERDWMILVPRWFSITVQLAKCTRMYFVPAIMNSVYLHRSWWCPYLHLTACGVNTIAYKNQLLIGFKWKSKDVKLRLMQNHQKQKQSYNPVP